MGLHRDDIPFEDMEEIEKALQEQHPGFKIQCVGDSSEVPEHIKKMMEELEERMKEAICNGQCFECGKQLPCEWPLPDGVEELPEGWSIYSMMGTVDGEKIPTLICPECE